MRDAFVSKSCDLLSRVIETLTSVGMMGLRKLLTASSAVGPRAVSAVLPVESSLPHIALSRWMQAWLPSEHGLAHNVNRKCSTLTGTTDDDGLERKKLLSSLMYRSKQRGFLELDLLVGLWAQQHLPSMTMPQLHAFSDVLTEENPDLFKWLTGQEAPTSAMASNTSFMAMRDDIGRQLAATRPPESATVAGKTWLRGWDDWQKNSVSETYDHVSDKTPAVSDSKGTAGKQSPLTAAMASAAGAVGGEPP